jgi:hypothetical protein
LQPWRFRWKIHNPFFKTRVGSRKHERLENVGFVWKGMVQMMEKN